MDILSGIDALKLLFLLWFRPCFANLVLCRLTGGTNGSAPSIAPSVSPLLEFGARATIGGGDKAVSPLFLEPNGLCSALHVHPGGCDTITTEEDCRL